MTSNNNGSLVQVIANGNSRVENIAINYQTYSFTNDRLILSRNVDKIIPEYIIFDLNSSDISLNTLFTCGKDVFVVFEIGGERILDFPFSLLWNFKQPEILDNQLYLYFPFKELFDTLFINSLRYHEAVFKIVNYNHLSNYSSNCSLLCKTTIYGSSQVYEVGYNYVQQISSLEVCVSNDTSLQTQLSNEFVINTNVFKGYTKGFLIESSDTNISDLNELQFYINGHNRMKYNRFLIRNKCVNMGEKMLFFPFNDDILFQDKSYNCYTGAINLSNLDRSTLRLCFNHLHSKVKIYAVSMNKYIQSRGIGRLEGETYMYHLKQDFTLHPLVSVDEIVSNALPIINNGINITNINNRNNNNIISNNNNIMYYNDISINTVQPNIQILPNFSPQTSEPINRVIPENKKTCGICLDEIGENERYMTCFMCTNNFKEQEITRWLESRRTCPSCRTIWTDLNVYINQI